RNLAAVGGGHELGRLSDAIARLLMQTCSAIDSHREAETRLEASETRFLAAAESIPDGLAILDADDRIVYFNARLPENMPPNLRATIAIGRRFEDCLKEAQAAGGIYHAAMGEDVLSQRLEAHRQGEGESLLHLSDDRFIRLRMSRMRDGGRVMLSTDITARQRLEDELHQAEKLTAVGTLASGIAHDFNNILATIFTSAEVALARQPEAGGARSSIERILTAGRRGRDLVNQILAFSRTERRPALAIELNQSVELAVNLCRPALDEGVEINLDLLEETIFVAADDTQIHQIISNLCANAAQAMPKGGHISIATRTDPARPGEVCLMVTDTGPGMSQDIAERVFEPFFTTKSVGQGTGLGLAVVHGIVKSLGGTAVVNTAPDAGCKIVIHLPHLHKSAAVDSAPTPEPPQGHQRTIMIVEADDDVSAAIVKMLRPAGYRLVRYDEAERALVHFDLSRERPVVLILGSTGSAMKASQMMDGLSDRGLSVPVIYAGEAEFEKRQISTQVAAAEIIRRPILRRELNAALHALLAPTSTH
ncbi:MAG: ATP-binding protein, partial [Pseudomonadota bacterium]